jgi:hypothetical protein
MVDDLERLHGTVLVWSALGGGSVSLPYLEHEAYGEVALRDRMYGQVNDAEFIAECDRRGIKVFGVVFEAQGWEFPVELDAEGRLLALNELRAVGRRDWLGLREFWQDRYPDIWPSASRYFPGGLRNSRGETVTDLLEECASRNLDGSPHRARWVECPDRDHQCYYMDRNNPVWREYLKAVIRVQVDAGVHGVQLDEASTPLGALQYGGCFCYDCLSGFRAYLTSLPDDGRPAELAGADLSSFDYADFLRRRGLRQADIGPATPLIEHYFSFQRQAITRAFTELADYARTYARSRGREVLVTGNLYNVFPYYNGLIDQVDLVVTEMRNVSYVQPHWYRYVVGMARGKQVLVVENPYGGVIPDLLRRLDQGRGYDLARLISYEAAAMGANMTVPYGAWMGSQIQDAFSLPPALAREIQSFLAQVDPYLSPLSCNDVAVLYDVASNALLSVRREVFSDNRVNDLDESVRPPFLATCAQLAAAGVPFDVVPLNDDVVPAWRFSTNDLKRYAVVVLPGDVVPPSWAREALDTYAKSGGRVLSWPGDADPDALLGLCRAASHVELASQPPVGVNTHDVRDGEEAVHLVNYDVDEVTGTVRPAHGVRLRLRNVRCEAAELLRPEAPPTVEQVRQTDAAVAEIVVPCLASYAVVRLLSGVNG